MAGTEIIFARRGDLSTGIEGKTNHIMEIRKLEDIQSNGYN